MEACPVHYSGPEKNLWIAGPPNPLCLFLHLPGFPNEPAADIALNTVKNWLKENSQVGRCRSVLSPPLALSSLLFPAGEVREVFVPSWTVDKTSGLCWVARTNPKPKATASTRLLTCLESFISLFCSPHLTWVHRT